MTNEDPYRQEALERIQQMHGSSARRNALLAAGVFAVVGTLLLVAGFMEDRPERALAFLSGAGLLGFSGMFVAIWRKLSKRSGEEDSVN